MPDSREERELAVLAKAGSQEACDRLACCNLRLVVKIARQLQAPGININDLIQEGNVGLTEAVRHFDLSYHVPFANFAAWWIKKRILKFVIWHRSAIRLPETQMAGLRKVLKAESDYIHKHGVPPPEEELPELSGVSPVITDTCRKAPYDRVSIDELKEDGIEFPDEGPGPDDMAAENIAIALVTECLESLPDDWQDFLKDRFGIGKKAMSLREIAKKRNITVEAVRQLRIRIMNSLSEDYAAGLAPYIEDLC